MKTIQQLEQALNAAKEHVKQCDTAFDVKPNRQTATALSNAKTDVKSIQAEIDKHPDTVLDRAIDKIDFLQKDIEKMQAAIDSGEWNAPHIVRIAKDAIEHQQHRIKKVEQAIARL